MIFQVVPLGLGIQSLAIYQRCMFSTSTATGNPENQGDANSGEGKKSEESHQSSDAGKPVRGGVLYYLLSFYFLFLFFKLILTLMKSILVLGILFMIDD